MSRLNAGVEISDEQRAELERLAATTQCLVKRAGIVLLRAQGCAQLDTAAEVGVRRPAVIRRERRFAGWGLAGTGDASGRGRKRSISEAQMERPITLATRPPANRFRWFVYRLDMINTPAFESA